MAWILCAIRKVSLRVARGVLAGVGRGGDWVCRRLEGGGSGAPPFPALLAGGALATTGKKLTERLAAPCFFCTPAIPYASKLATVCPGTKKALKRCLRAFFRCCGERGIRTPGTVTRTSV